MCKKQSILSNLSIYQLFLISLHVRTLAGKCVKHGLGLKVLVNCQLMWFGERREKKFGLIS